MQKGSVCVLVTLRPMRAYVSVCPPLLAMDVTLAIRLVATLSNPLSRSEARILKDQSLRADEQDVTPIRADEVPFVEAKVADSARLNGNARHSSSVRCSRDRTSTNNEVARSSTQTARRESTDVV